MNVDHLEVSAYQVPTNKPEADGTLDWDSTTIIVVEACSDSGLRGLGLSYASKGAAVLVQEKLESQVQGCPVEDVRQAWERMVNSVRNVGRPGAAANAISAVDIALWDLKARALGQPLFKLLGPVRDFVPIYGSGGFTTYSTAELIEQLGGWVSQGIMRVKMKIGTSWGTRAAEDIERARAVRRAIGQAPELFVDANGAYHPTQAIEVAKALAGEAGVTYFEEPVSSDHLDQLRLVREHTPLDVAAGEYGYDPWYFADMLSARAVDILQADVTRCLGVTGWLQAASLAYGHATSFSAHCAPSVHVHAACAAPQIAHLEYFWDHTRIDSMLFEGAAKPVDGCLRPDPSAPGLGLEFKRQDAEQYRVL